VTDKEMEQARTIAAKAYLRFANDGSGYLDDVNATSMTELRKSLKKKEVENLAAFTAIKTPSDYASWDKDKLISYWVSVLDNKTLLDKGKAAKGRIPSVSIAQNPSLCIHFVNIYPTKQKVIVNKI